MAAEFGYAGKILKVDLSSPRISSVATSDYAARFIGGRGIAAKIYWDEVSPDTKALDPENRLILMTGPMAGYPGTAGSMCQVSGKTPAAAPEQFFYSNLGGSWGARLKFAGYDGVVVHGASEKPVYLLVHDGTAELKDASGMRNKDVDEVTDQLKRELGNSTNVLTIGQAGENLVPFSVIRAEGGASAWGGGAVMGSKHLKAISGNRQRQQAAGGSSREAGRTDKISAYPWIWSRLWTRDTAQCAVAHQETADLLRLHQGLRPFYSRDGRWDQGEIRLSERHRLSFRS